MICFGRFFDVIQWMENQALRSARKLHWDKNEENLSFGLNEALNLHTLWFFFFTVGQKNGLINQSPKQELQFQLQIEVQIH